MSKAQKKLILKGVIIITLLLSIFNQGIAQETIYSGNEPVNKKFLTESLSEDFSQLPEKFHWFAEAKFGLFIHWGMYSIPASMWDGVPAGKTSEYIMMTSKIPVKTYKTLADYFNPFQFDAERWVKMAKDAGMQYVVFVSKHHDGFAMFHSKVSTYNVVDATPWKRDPLKELSQACRKYDMRLGVYYSHAVDWEDPNGAGNTWDYNKDEQDFDKFLREKSLPQVRELLTNYGQISTFWFDWPTKLMTEERCKPFSDLARELQPDILINSRLGPDPTVDFRSMGDNQIPNAKVHGVWETAGTMTTSNGTWGHNQWDQDWKSLSTITFNLVDIISKGGNYLLNTGPTSDGVIPRPTQEVLAGIGRWLRVNGESIYGAGRTPFGFEYGNEIPGEKDRWGNPPFDIKKELRFTTRPGKLYVHIFDWPNDHLRLNGLKDKVKNVYFLADPARKSLSFYQEGETFKLYLPEQAPDVIDTVVCLELIDKQ